MVVRLLAAVAAYAGFALAQGSVNGQVGAENATTPTAQEGNITIHYVTVGHALNNFYVSDIQLLPHNDRTDPSLTAEQYQRRTRRHCHVPILSHKPLRHQSRLGISMHPLRGQWLFRKHLLLRLDARRQCRCRPSCKFPCGSLLRRSIANEECSLPHGTSQSTAQNLYSTTAELPGHVSTGAWSV